MDEDVETLKEQVKSLQEQLDPLLQKQEQKRLKQEAENNRKIEHRNWLREPTWAKKTFWKILLLPLLIVFINPAFIIIWVFYAMCIFVIQSKTEF